MKLLENLAYTRDHRRDGVDGVGRMSMLHLGGKNVKIRGDDHDGYEWKDGEEERREDEEEMKKRS